MVPWDLGHGLPLALPWFIKGLGLEETAVATAILLSKCKVRKKAWWYKETRQSYTDYIRLLLLHVCYLRLHLNCSKHAHIYSWITRLPFHVMCGGGLGLKMKFCWEVQTDLETQISFQLSNRIQRDLMPRWRSQKLILPALGANGTGSGSHSSSCPYSAWRGELKPCAMLFSGQYPQVDIVQLPRTQPCCDSPHTAVIVAVKPLKSFYTDLKASLSAQIVYERNTAETHF